MLLLRDAMRKCGLCCRPVSVCHVRVRPGSPSSSAGTQFQGEPLQQGALNTRVGEICDFPLKSPFIWETVQHMPMVAMER